MDNPQFQQHGRPHPEGDAHTGRSRRKRPIHHSPFFWVGAFFILVAMIVYVATNDLSFWPNAKPVPALAP